MQDLRPSPTPLAGEQIPDFFADQLRQGTDAKTWRTNLAASGAAYLVVSKSGQDPSPEFGMIAERRAAFETLYDGPAAAVFRVRDPKLLVD
jgi:hypothetical protein